MVGGCATLFAGLQSGLTGHAAGEEALAQGCGGIEAEDLDTIALETGGANLRGKRMQRPAQAVRDILSGKQFIRVAPGEDLTNPYFDLVPISPIYRQPDKLATRIAPALITQAETYGYRVVVPRKVVRTHSLPPYVILHAPLPPEYKGRRIVVDPKRCNRKASSVAELIHGGACDLRTALTEYCSEKYDNDAGTPPVEIALRGGRHVDNSNILDLCKGVAITNYRNETVELSAEIDLNVHTSTQRWHRVADFGEGRVWSLNWDTRIASSGYWGLKAPLFMDGKALTQVMHVDDGTKGADVPRRTFLDHIKSHDAAYMYFHRSHQRSDTNAFLNDKSECYETENHPLPSICRGGVDITKITHDTIYDTWFSRLCPHAENICMILTLPKPSHPSDYDLRSNSAWTGFMMRQTQRSDSGFINHDVYIKGLKLHPSFLSMFYGADPKTPKAQFTHSVSVDGIEASGQRIWFIGGGTGLNIENSYLHDADHFLAYSDTTDRTFQKSRVVNNFMDNSIGKAVTIQMVRDDYATLKGVTWTGEAKFNRFSLNTLHRATAINTLGLHHWLIEHNYFGHGGIQEGILDLDGHADHVRVQQNWLYDSIGTGIHNAVQIHQAPAFVNELHILDNQFVRSPGGDGPSNSYCAQFAGAYADRCKNTRAWAIMNLNKHTEVEKCRGLRIENNLMVQGNSRQKGIWTMECDQSSVSNNSIYGENAFGYYLASGRSAATDFTFSKNVSIGASSSYPARFDLALFPFWPGNNSTHADVRTADLSDSTRYHFSDNSLAATHSSACDPWTGACPFVDFSESQINAHWARLGTPDRLNYRVPKSRRGFHYLDQLGDSPHVIPRHLKPYRKDAVSDLLSRASGPALRP
jgi:hypothetical protein